MPIGIRTSPDGENSQFGAICRYFSQRNRYRTHSKKGQKNRSCFIRNSKMLGFVAEQSSYMQWNRWVFDDNWRIIIPPPPHTHTQNVVFIPPAKCSFRGVYWFQHVHDSVIPSTFKVFTTLIAFVRFCSNLHHTLIIRQCMFGMKIGAAGSVLQRVIMLLCNSYNKMVVVLSLIVIPSTFKFLLYNFNSFCPILFIFTPHHNHQTMHVW